MRYRFYLLMLMMLMPVVVFSQSSNWLSTIDLNVSVSSSDRIDLYTDKDGNHIIVQESDELVYYLFSSTGTQIRTSVRDNNVSEYPRLSRIIGWEGKLYIIYKEANKIKTQKSTDSGANWSTAAINEITMTSSTSNGLEVWADADGIHLVYSEFDSDNDEYNTFYRRVEHDASQWSDFKQVTDEANVSGGFPGVTTSANRVHVAFTAGSFQNPIYNASPAKTRDRSSGTWQSSQLIFEGASRSMLIANNENLHAFYYDYVPNYYHFDLYYRYRDFESTSWSSPELLDEYSDPEFSTIDMAVSFDNKVHILYGENDGIYNVLDNGWGTGYTITAQSHITYSQAIAANNNDIYAIWNDYYNESSTIMLRQRDFAPLAPQNLTATANRTYDPVELNWDANTEADIDQYKIYRASNYSSTPPASGYELIATLNAYSGGNPVTSYTDEEVFAYPSSWWVHYKIRAVDLEAHNSSYSNIASFNAVLYKSTAHNEEGKIKPVISDYFLNQNYPNPFNPSTTIQFGLRNSGPVELSVFNLSGQAISTLINAYLIKGYHQATWNGTDQEGKPVSSGIYVYQLKAGDQRLVKKMMLIK